MVVSKALVAKIDRPIGIVCFQTAKDSNNVLNSWASNLEKLLDLVEKSCHQIHKEIACSCSLAGNFWSSVLSPSVAKLSLSDQAFFPLAFVACTTSVAFTSLVIAAVPTLFAMGRAAISLSKLSDTAREELPSTMAAIRLSGMEISDLTLELNDFAKRRFEPEKKPPLCPPLPPIRTGTVALVELGAQSVIEREGLEVEVRETELNLQRWRRVIEEEEKDDDEV
ncbi:hypothetical protein L3X38_001320 [Prunus dulcis]|uniref:26S proteasome regulatory subunit RPN5 C-terminal domain-containing protein n=1 Tax=Prunus dulcis TaxID=3755 RepID=A0AAD4WSB9_PRUDU|nr:hypothetical protein L3X38_001320 [Prunus dulcis]